MNWISLALGFAAAIWIVAYLTVSVRAAYDRLVLHSMTVAEAERHTIQLKEPR